MRDNLRPLLRVVVEGDYSNTPRVLLYHYLVFALVDLLDYLLSNFLFVMLIRKNNELETLGCKFASM